MRLELPTILACALLATIPAAAEDTQPGDAGQSVTTYDADSLDSVTTYDVESPTRNDARPPKKVLKIPPITLGNGKSNWIIVEGATRKGATFRFSEVQIDGNGWLVMHPFRDGAPFGDLYVGHIYLESGSHRDVDIAVEPEPSAGDMFLVMLHSDVNDNQEFDFIDGRNVVDKAVFEGRLLIAHTIPAP